MALDLSDQPAGNGFSFATVVWAPDSKRFAFNYGQGRTHATSLYQLRNEKWVALKSPSEDNEIEKRANDIVADQLKAQGLSEKKLSKQGKYLRLIWWTVNVDRWIDSNTAIAYASLRQVVARRDDPGEMDDGCGTDLLFTLRFDGAGKWKIVKTHRMSEKEVKEHNELGISLCSPSHLVFVQFFCLSRLFMRRSPHLPQRSSPRFLQIKNGGTSAGIHRNLLKSPQTKL